MISQKSGLLVLSLTLLCGTVIHAQTSVIPDTAPQIGSLPTRLYTIDKLETIDRVSGNVLYKIPLATLPRVGPSDPFQLALVYNSNTLRANYTYISDPRLQPGQVILKANLYADDGWNFNFRYALIKQDRRLPNEPGSNCSSEQDYKVYKMYFQTPDGGSHALDLYSYADAGGDGFYSVDPNTFSSLDCSGATPITGPLTYYTNDGSYIKVVVSSPQSSSTTSIGWTAYFPDGTVVSQPGQVDSNFTETITDRNGNTTTITSTDNNVTNTTISNAAGSIQMTYSGNSAQGTTTISTTGYNGAPLVWTIDWNTINFAGGTGTYYCDELNDTCDASQSARVVTAIHLPSPTGVPLTFQFGYSDATNKGWGNVNYVQYPSGAVVRYQYQRDGTGTGVGAFFLTNPVTRKEEDYTETQDGASTPKSYVWTFSYYVNNTTCNNMTGPDGGTETDCFMSLDRTSEALTGTTYKTISPTGRLDEKQFSFNRPLGDDTPAPNPYVSLESVALANSGQPTVAAVTSHTLDQNGNETQTTEYDYVPYSAIGHNSQGQLAGNPSGNTLRTTTNVCTVPVPAASGQAANDSANGYWNPASPNLRDLVARTVISGSGPGAATEYSYDGRGNVGEFRRWDSTKSPSLPASLNGGNALVESRTYSQLHGNLTSSTDPRGIQTCYGYDTNDLYLTQIKYACNSSPSYTTTFTRDPSTGLATSKTDPNQITTGYNYDALGRLTLVQEAQGKSEERDTQTIYEDGNQRLITKQDLNQRGDGALVSVSDYDPLGRIQLTRQLEDSSAQSADAVTDGIKVQTRYWTTNGFHYQLVSNPYRASSSGSAGSESSMGWTLMTSDQENRPISVQSFVGAALPAPWGGNTTTAGVTTTSYNSQVTTVTDQAGVTRQNTTDALGRLTGVVEDPNGLNYGTSYGYDALDDLSSITQGTSCPNGCEVRLFTYDSLKRLTKAINPESGTTTYGYDGDGNLTAKTDARGNTVSYDYDPLNRILDKTYANNAANVVWTPNVTYTYDQGGENSIGHLTQVTANGHSSTSYGPFDALGHVLNSSQSTANTLYAFAYTYNLAGGLKSETYPSGRVVNTSYDAAGRISQLLGTLNGSVKTYVDGVDGTHAISYAPQGAPGAFIYGNGFRRTNTYNSRLQLQESRDQSSSQPNVVFDLQYFWGDNASQTTNNNGNLRGELITNTGIGPYNSWEVFQYDRVNRLQSINDNGDQGAQSNNERDYAYDQYGNMWVTNNAGFMASGTLPSANIYNNVNRFNNTSYDAAGNQLSINGDAVAYDAEGRTAQLTELASLGNATMTYFYDGEGRRVEKLVDNAATTLYVYDAQGQLSAEYAASATPAAPCQTCYLSTDHLGSTRLVTDQQGTVVARHDYLPFGQEIINAAGRTSLWGAPDDVNQKFTGKERDSESGLDYFGARYYGSSLGRFTSPDWSEKPEPVPYADLTNPQSLNLYGYVLNNPLSRVDPNGHFDCTGANAQKVGCQYIANWNQEHGIDPTAKKSNAPGVPVKLPNGKTVQDPYTHQPLMSPTADLSNVAAKGKQIKSDVMLVIGYGQDLTNLTGAIQLGDELKEAVAQNGDFDYQRTTLAAGDLQQLPQFRDVSNFNVGLIGQQAGLSLDTLLQIVGSYAKGHSSNARPDQPYGLDPRTRKLTVLGYQTGESGAYDH